jgi:hypothetical protein
MEKTLMAKTSSEIWSGSRISIAEALLQDQLVQFKISNNSLEAGVLLLEALELLKL